VFLRRLGEQVDQTGALAPRRRLGGNGEQGDQFCPGAWTPRRRHKNTDRGNTTIDRNTQKEL
jgi:hypothetical protein